MLRTSCCPFSIGVCAGCWVDVQQFGGGAPANEFIDQTGSAQLLCWDTCYLFHSTTFKCTRSSWDRGLNQQNSLGMQIEDRLQGQRNGLLRMLITRLRWWC